MSDKARGIITFVVLYLAALIFCFFIGFNSAAYGWNKGETELLNLAYQEGKKIGQPELLQIIMMNETVVGRWGRYGDDHFRDWKMHCFGVMQIQFNTARLFVNKFTSYKLNDKELVRRLRFDDAFCIEIAGIYAKWLLDFNAGDLHKTILSYNVGPGNVRKYGLSFDPNKYLKRAMLNLKRYIVPFNRKQGNGCLVEYKIRKYDTLYKIAANLLSDGKRWREILELNPDVKPTDLKIGSVLIVRR